MWVHILKLLIIEGFVLLKYCLSEISNIVLTNTSLKRRVRRLMHTQRVYVRTTLMTAPGG